MISNLIRANGAKRSGQAPEISSIHCLEAGAATSMWTPGKKNLQIAVHEGRAWITYGKVDVVVETGQTVAIPSTKQAIVISPVNNRRGICYEVVGSSNRN